VTSPRRAARLQCTGPLHFRNPHSFLHVARDYPSNSRDKRTIITHVGYNVNNILSNVPLRVAYSTPTRGFLIPSKFAMRRQWAFNFHSSVLRMEVDGKLASNAGAHASGGEKVRNV